MPEQAKRTIHSLKKTFQKVINFEYEVILIDNNSDHPIEESLITTLPKYFRYVYFNTSSKSPCRALNYGVEISKYKNVCMMIDGARLITPGVMTNFNKILVKDNNAMVETIGWHIGPSVHQEAKFTGYNEEKEYELLKKIDWKNNPYKLKDYSTLSKSSVKGIYEVIAESNCFVISKHNYWRVGGFDEKFVSAGGGFANLDIYKRMVEDEIVNVYRLKEEGNFHQIHSGASTSDSFDMEKALNEYNSLRGRPYNIPNYKFKLINCN